MRYSNCRQARNPVLRNLEAGDVIFFGSLKKGRTERRFNFYLDTVFVVAAGHEYQKAPRLQVPEAARVDAIYLEHGLERLGHPFPKRGHVLYDGAKLGESGERALFSLVPCKAWQGDPASARFARPMINDIFEVAFTDPRKGLLPVQEGMDALLKDRQHPRTLLTAAASVVSSAAKEGVTSIDAAYLNKTVDSASVQSIPDFTEGIDEAI